MFNPTGNKIVVKPETIKKEEVTDSGLIISREKKDTHLTVMSGYVESVGMDVREVHVGYEVFYELHASHVIEVKGIEYVVIQESSILGYEKPENVVDVQPINEG